MRFLLLNQTFHPDVMATGQYLTEVALALVERGHEVTVVTSRRAYDDPAKRFPESETWRGIRILRLGSTGLGKGAKWRRAADFASFTLACCARLATLPKHDVVMALTTPPLISFIGAWLAKLRGSRFVYWVMDFNPDEAIAAGWLRADSLAAKVLDGMSRFSLRQAAKIIALDRFMCERIRAKGIPAEKIAVLPPWSHDDEVRFDARGREQFRKNHGLEDKFVVMYSGNHSPVHPLDTLLQAAERLQKEKEIVFCFVGGGNEWRKIKHRVDTINHQPSTINILCLPYQPLSQLSASLSAADLHVVVMGDAMVGLVHPCKIYNILSVGAPVLAIGPRSSHLSEILGDLNSSYPSACASHGDVEAVVQHIARMRLAGAGRGGKPPLMGNFSKETLLPRLTAVLEGKPFASSVEPVAAELTLQ